MRFTAYRDVGNPVSQARIAYANGADEIMILNTQPERGIQPLLDVLADVSELCFIPIAAGGGITKPEQAGELISSGCEKVVIRSCPHIIPDIAKRCGTQSVVECRDYLGKPPIHDIRGGELLLQSMDRDGTMDGYDPTPVSVNVPVIRLGGCGNYWHMAEAFRNGADACAAGSLWNFSDSNPMRAKSYLRNHGINCRD